MSGGATGLRREGADFRIIQGARPYSGSSPASTPESPTPGPRTAWRRRRYFNEGITVAVGQGEQRLRASSNRVEAFVRSVNGQDHGAARSTAAAEGRRCQVER